MDDLLPIGRFARLAGLSVGALRHYDELDLLRPAEVDGFTGYRRYRPSQLEDARTIARLRELEVPLDEIRDVLATDDPVERARRLADHRARIEARTFRLQRVLHHVGQRRRTEGAHRDDATRSAGARPGDPPRARGRPLQPHLDAARDRPAHGPSRTTR